MGVALFLPDGLSLVLRARAENEDRRGGSRGLGEGQLGCPWSTRAQPIFRLLSSFLVSNIDCTSFYQGDSVIKISSSGYDTLFERADPDRACASSSDLLPSTHQPPPSFPPSPLARTFQTQLTRSESTPDTDVSSTL